MAIKKLKKKGLGPEEQARLKQEMKAIQKAHKIDCKQKRQEQLQKKLPKHIKAKKIKKHKAKAAKE